MCGVPVHAAEAYLARLIRGGPPRRHRRADRKPRRSAQGARVEGAGRPRDRPPGHAGNADRGDLARIRRGQLAGGDRPGRATNGRSPPPTFRPGGSSWSPAGPGELAAELARLSPAETIADASVPGLPHHARARAGSTASRASARSRRASGLRRSTGSAPVARRAGGGGRAARLSRRDAEGRRHPARRAAPRVALGAHGDRCGDPRQPRADAARCRAASREACSARSTAARRPPAGGCSRRTSPRR